MSMSYEVTIEPLGQTIKVGKNQTILDAALRSGVNLPHACSHGLCATCKVNVLNGEVDPGDHSSLALVDAERAEGKCLACCAVPLSDLVIETSIPEESDIETHALRNYVGFVTNTTMLTPHIRAIFISIEGDSIDFQAGQYVNIEVPGIKQPRAFSIASAPSERSLIELNVAFVSGGKATQYLLEEVQSGDALNFSGPLGRFHVRKSAPQPILFLAWDSGLSSLKSMILDLFENDESRPVTFIYGARNKKELYYRALFEELAKEHENFEFLPALSAEPIGSDWRGLRGLVHEAAAERFSGSFSGMKAYICGPPKMITACVNTLIRGRLFEEDIYIENFFNNSIRSKRPKGQSPRSI